MRSLFQLSAQWHTNPLQAGPIAAQIVYDVEVLGFCCGGILPRSRENGMNESTGGTYEALAHAMAIASMLVIAGVVLYAW